MALHVFVFLSVIMACWELKGCQASGSFGFDVHHLFSDSAKQFLGFDGVLPEKGSLDYFKLLAHRDRFIRGRGLASNNDQSPLTFIRGNRTLELGPLGFLHYANVSVGTPATWFFVALDTGSDLFWLPCHCGTTCINDLKDAGLSRSIPLNLYSPNASSTSSRITCSDNRCFQSELCPSTSSICPYKIEYLSSNTSSSGTLIQDVLHLVTEDETLQPVEANITLGCGQVQTGAFRKRAAVNGLFGLGLEDYSVPSTLAKAGIIPNSFSMCFGNIIDVVGRISFGDKGELDQQETPLISVKPTPTYVVKINGIEVGGNTVGGVPMFALVDSGTSFTHLLQPAYGAVTKAFNALVTDKRSPVDPDFPFEFCYDLSPNFTSIVFPAISITMSGGSTLTLRNPLLVVQFQNGTTMYCLAVLESVDFKLNIIGQNFMSGYRVVFDRDRMVLGWKESDCYGDESGTSPAPPPRQTAAPPPKVSAVPSQSPPPAPPPPPPTNFRGFNTSSGTRHSPLASPLLIPLLLAVMAFL